MSTVERAAAAEELQERFVELCIRAAPNVEAARVERRQHAPDEFKMLAYRYREKLKIEVIGDTLVTQTLTPIVIRGYHIGILRTVLNGISKDHRIYNLTLSGHAHPHVSELSPDGSAGGHICWGKDTLAFENAVKGGYFYRAQCMIMSTLENVNDAVPHITTYKALNKYPLDIVPFDGGSL